MCDTKDLRLEIAKHNEFTKAILTMNRGDDFSRAAASDGPRIFNATFNQQIIQAEIMHDKSVDKHPILIMLFAQNRQPTANKSVQVYQYNQQKNVLKLKQTIKLPNVKATDISFQLLLLKKSLRLLIVSYRGHGPYSHKIYEYRLDQEKFEHMKTLSGDYDLIAATVVNHLVDEVMLIAGKTGSKTVTIFRVTTNDSRMQIYQKILFDAKILALNTFFMDGEYCANGQFVRLYS
jgi:hypothetical protein